MIFGFSELSGIRDTDVPFNLSEPFYDIIRHYLLYLFSISFDQCLFMTHAYFSVGRKKKDSRKGKNWKARYD